MLEAGSLDARLEVRRQVAWRVFDAGATERGEQAWAESSELATRLRDVQARAAQLLESARLIDPTGPEARPLLARLLYERALEAERQGDRAAQQENLARLASYDDGTLGRQWSAPATLTVTTPAPGATVALGRYEPTAEQRYVLAPIELGPGGLQDVVLAPGAYRIDLRAPGRAPVVHTLRLGRGERSTLQLDMPLVGTVPAGFVYVPPGRFVFGSAAPDGQRRDFFHTTPAHEVDGRAFLIAAHETTFADWIAYLKALPAAARQEATPKVVAGGFQGGLGLASGGDDDWELTIQPAGQAYRARSGELLTYPGRTLRAAQNWLRFPVSGISVAQAEAYVTWLAQSGRVPNARLCTEHEWEHAARGADGREYPHGERLLPDDANHDETYGKASLALGPDEVGSHGASSSPYGVQDMAGNVWEWTRSSLAGNSHAARGGSFAFGPNSSRSTDRELTEPSFRDVSVGLRVCADAPLTDAPGR
jgi:formylglycine-generating enzyme required for sulfatase activity